MDNLRKALQQSEVEKKELKMELKGQIEGLQEEISVLNKQNMLLEA